MGIESIRTIVWLTVALTIGCADGAATVPQPSPVPISSGPTVSAEAYTTRVAIARARRDLIDATPEELKQAALDMTRARYDVLSGEPQVVVARPMRPGDLGSSSIACPPSDDDPANWLVIVHGDFDVRRRLIGLGNLAPGPRRVAYIAYVIDLRVGRSASTMMSADGSAFQRELDEVRGITPATLTPMPTPSPTVALPTPETPSGLLRGCEARAYERAYTDRVWGPAPPTFTAVPRPAAGASQGRGQ